MKRTTTMLLALLLLIAAFSAQAEALSIPIDGVPVGIDLDGDGAEETVACVMLLEDGLERLQLQVSPQGRAAVSADTDICVWTAGRAADLNGDGLVELLLSGDVMSDDYFTWCYNYVNGRLKPVLFADVNRGDNGAGYFRQGYGQLIALDPAAGTVTLSGSQDVLGTWFGRRTLKLSEDGLFECADDGLWRRYIDPADADVWEYGALTVKTALPCRLAGAEATLNPGDRILVTGSDKLSRATFVTPDGQSGEISIAQDFQRGWGWLAADVPEEEAFETVPYAD